MSNPPRGWTAAPLLPKRTFLSSDLPELDQADLTLPRIVSLLPAGTEIVAALGAVDDLVGRSHECDFPPRVRELPIVSKPSLALDGLSQAEIDTAVTVHMDTGESLYVVDERILNDLAPDIVLTQDLCQVCAPSGNELSRALTSVSSKPSVLYLTPRTLDEIDENILDVGEAIGRGAEAARIVDHNRARVREWRFAAARRTHRPRVTFLEWTDPPFCAGHWVPEMIELAGGVDRLARPGADSVRVSWDDIRAWNPEVVIVAPCGFGLADAERLARDLPPLGDACIVPVDANAFFARPGPRYVEGIEVLSRAIRQLDAI